VIIMKTFRYCVLAAGLFAAFPTFAHESKGPHGGRVVDAGNYHVEMVVTDSGIDLYVTDGAEKPVATMDMKAVAILNAEGKAQRIQLQPVQPGKLHGKAETSLPVNVKGVVQLTAANGAVRSAQFK
jgi:hypothetical protein